MTHVNEGEVLVVHTVTGSKHFPDAVSIGTGRVKSEPAHLFVYDREPHRSDRETIWTFNYDNVVSYGWVEE